jgi:uncharacterized protein
VKSAEPASFSVDDAGIPTLLGVRDGTGCVSHPSQRFGSLLNGDHGAHLVRVEMTGTGRILAVATVYRHPGADVSGPFTVASIILDEGPLVRGILAGESRDAKVGAPVRAVTIVNPNGVAELRFRTDPRGRSA